MLTSGNDGILGRKWIMSFKILKDIDPFKPILPTFQYSNIPNLKGVKCE